ncbi:MAG: hypothetical protein DME92_00235 [Verrucomicrobia bacterium]|nr:MAG: hypothetical protein DME92_00235 [Verrucomicrobiota bacterium]PYJ61880.1 MAG: hypothetical protein DME74_07150 [Verrucomicrobiota bacterium]
MRRHVAAFKSADMSAHSKLRPELGTAQSHMWIEKHVAAIRQQNVSRWCNVGSEFLLWLAQTLHYQLATKG